MTASTPISGEVYGAEPQPLAANHNVIVAVPHHPPNPRSRLTRCFVGSGGLPSIVDTVIVAERGRGSADVVMRVTGRDLPEDEYAFDIDFDTFTWRFIGDATTAQLTSDRRAVIDVVVTNRPSTPTEIADATGLKIDNMKHLVRRMANDGLIKNHGDGTYGPPPRYVSLVPLVPQRGGS